MAEVIGAVSAVSAIASLVDLGAKLLANGYTYAAKVKRAPLEIHSLLHEVAGLNVVLTQVQDWINESENGNNKSDDVVAALSRMGVIDSCRELLKNVESTVKACEQTQGQHVKNIGKKLAWPVKEREVRDTIQQLARLRETLSASMAMDSRAAINRLEVLANQMQADITDVKSITTSEVDWRKRQTLLRWISPEDSNPEENFEAAIQQRQENTGMWFLDCKNFKSWLNETNSLLWIHGIPGCGKTVLSATVIEYLQQSERVAQSAVAYFYCDHRFPKKQTLRNFFMTVAAQLIRGNLECLTEVELLFDGKNRDTESKISDSEYRYLINSLSLRYSRVYIIVDALDECKYLETFVQGLCRLCDKVFEKSHCQIMVSSRKDVHIEKLLLPYATIEMSLNDQMRKDIKTFVSTQAKTRLATKKFMSRDPDLLTQVVKTLVDNAQGLFLQAKMQLDYLCKLKTLGAVENALQKLPTGLDETYDQILQQVISSNPDDLHTIKSMLQWLVGGVWELRVEALSEALAIRLDDAALQLDNVWDPEDAAKLCSSLVIVDRDSKGATIRLAHFSIEEYLFSQRLAESPLHFFHMDHTTVESALALTCIKYLSFQDFSEENMKKNYPHLTSRGSLDGSPKISSLEDSAREYETLTENYQFLEYASSNWMIHLAKTDIPRSAFDKAFTPYLTWFLEAKVKNRGQYWVWNLVLSHSSFQFLVPKSPQPPFYNAIMFGLNHVFDILLPSFQGIDKLLSSGYTPLTAAARFDQLEIARKLLHAGADPNVAANRSSRKGLTALHIAAQRSNEAMAELLLQSGASPHVQSTSLSTPLYRAARSGSTAVLKLLYNAGADINASTYDHWTPIFEAVHSGHTDALDLLLAWGAKTDVCNDDGDTPLSYAWWLSSDDMVDAILGATGASRENVDFSKMRPPREASLVSWYRLLTEREGKEAKGAASFETVLLRQMKSRNESVQGNV